MFELIVLWLLNELGIKEIPEVVALVLIILFSFPLIFSLRKDTYRNSRSAIFAGYLFRVVLLLFDIYGQNIYRLPNSGADTETFYVGAVNFAKSGNALHGGFFSTCMGYFFRYFGVSRIFGQFIVLLFSIVSLFYAAKTFELLKVDNQNVRTTMWIVSLLPNFAILSSIFLRESVVTMFISISLYEYVRWMKTKRERHFLLALVCIFAASRFHSGSIAAAVGYLLSRLIYNKKTGKLSLSFGSIFTSTFLLLASIFVLNKYGDKFLGKFSSVDSLSDIAGTYSRGGASYAQYVGNSNNPLNMVIYTIPRIVFFLFSPMPWMWRGISDIIAFCFSSCFYLWTICSFISFLRRGEQENRALVITLFIVAMCAAFVFGWGVSNSGTACRHREKMEVVWAVLLGMTMKNMKNRRDIVSIYHD